MNAQTSEQKKALRALMLQKRRSLSPDYRQHASHAAAQIALNILPEETRQIALYAALPDELDPTPLAQRLAARGATLLYPKVTKGEPLAFYPSSPDQLTLSDKNIPEPTGLTQAVPLQVIDAFFIPGLAFDSEGARLGFGGGFFDRTLPLAKPTSLRIGYAFSCQWVEAVPYTALDQKVHAVVTEHGVRWMSWGPFSYKALQGAKESYSHGSS
jgi:5-formyltetrahydrofolate cyclo-ligase